MTIPSPPHTPHAAAPVVFVSSTVWDLADLRAGIGYVLRQRGVNVMMSEASDFPLYGDKSAIEECLENVRRSDLYVLVVDKRRGSLYESGVSVTRKEMKVARESFATTGKPHHLLFVRRGIRQLVSRRNAALLQAGVDDPAHLRSFIKEITNPGDPTIPNFLKEFESFGEIMDPITSRLNLGRNFAESLARRSVYAELTRNLAKMVNRAGSSALAKHAFLSTLGIEVENQPITGTIGINSRQRTRIVMGIFGRVRGSWFELEAIRSAIMSGIFLDYDPASGEMVETATHKALTQVVDDVTDLAWLDSDQWDKRLLLALANAEQAYQISVNDLVFALGFASRAENLFNQMKTACWLLSGSVYGILSTPRLPTTPLGPEMELQIRKERVEPWEVEHLLTQDIHPFGAKIPADLSERTRDGRLQQALELVRRLAAANPQLIAEDDLSSIADRIVDHMVASPDEGLQDPTS